MITTTFGGERKFEEAGSVIRAVPKLDGDSITEVAITFMNGEPSTLERMRIDIRNRYTGALYSTWLQGAQ